MALLFACSIHVYLMHTVARRSRRHCEHTQTSRKPPIPARQPVPPAPASCHIQRLIMMRRKPNHRLQKICGPYDRAPKRKMPGGRAESPVQISRTCSTTLFHAINDARTATRIHHRHSVTYHMRHFLRASMRHLIGQNKYTRLSPEAKERLIVKISSLMSFTRLLKKPRTRLSPRPASFTKS